VTKGFGHHNSWTFGNCKSDQAYKWYSTYIAKCCQPEGAYELACKDSAGDGWNGGYIEIEGNIEGGYTKYCENFRAGKFQNHNVTMSGNVKFIDIVSSTKFIKILLCTVSWYSSNQL